jgi:hypothetical protein
MVFAGTSLPVSSDHARVVAGHRHRRRAVLYRLLPEADRTSGDRPSGLRLPPMVDYRSLQEFLRPDERVGIGALAGEE